MIIIAALRFSLFTVVLVSSALTARAQGTIAFTNGVLTRYSWDAESTPVPVVFGVFWGTNANNLRLAPGLGTGSVSSVGFIVAPSVFPIPGTEPGQTVYLQVKGWAESYGTNWMEARRLLVGYGETDVRQVTLGPTAGPGTVIWQGRVGTNTNRFHPLILSNRLMPPTTIRVGHYLRSSITVDEGNRGTVDVVIPIYRSSPPGVINQWNFTSSVIVCTTNGTALEREDFLPVNAVVTFNPGEIYKYVRITILADADPEPDEQFGVYLKSNGGLETIDPGVFTVNIREARLLSVRREGGQSIISLRTVLNQHYAMEYSTNFVNWAYVPGALFIDGNGGTVEVTDAFSGCCGHRFYRARLLPQ